MSINDMNAKASAYFDIMAQIEALTAEAEGIKDAIKSAMMEIEQEEISGDGWRATWHNTNNTRFDSKAFKAAHADLYAQYSIKTTGTRFTLNAVSA